MSSAHSFAFMILNASLEDDLLIPYMDALKTGGVGGVCIHPRDGMQSPYLSRDFWNRVERIIDLARDRKMEVWFYDEYPFPSGVAGGMIPSLHPETWAKTLEFEEVNPELNEYGLVDLGHRPLLGLLRYSLARDGSMKNLTDVTADTGAYFDTWVWGEWHNRFYTGALHYREELHERAGTERFAWVYKPQNSLGSDRLLAIRLKTPSGKKGWPAMVDLTRPEVTDLFLETVYRPYGDLAVRKGMHGVPMFQDEVTFYCEKPWSSEIERRLQPIWGDNWRIHLAALHNRRMDGWELRRFEYRRATQDAFEANWYERVSAFCREHNMRMTGHLPGEESIGGHCQLLGHMFRNLGHFEIPGYDIISSTISDDIDHCHAVGVKLVQSAAWIAGRKPTMAEVFGAFGFSFDLQKARTVFGWLALHGIYTLVDHSLFTSSLSIRKYDAPPVNNRFNPLFRGYADLWAWQSWFADQMEEFPFDPETLILMPVESLARYQLSEMGPGAPMPEGDVNRPLSEVDPAEAGAAGDGGYSEVSLLETFYFTVTSHTTDALYFPSEGLADIERRPGGGFWFRGHYFKTLIVPPVRSMHVHTFEALVRLSDAPGFKWVTADGKRQMKVFGPDFIEESRAIPVEVKGCDEEVLREQKGAWFDDLIGARTAGIHSDVTVLKSIRRSAANPDESLLVLINTLGREVKVWCHEHPGVPIAQPPGGALISAVVGEEGYSVTLPPRATALFRQDLERSAERPALTLQARELEYRLAGVNHLNLKQGTALLDSGQPTDFKPGPISSLWKLEGIEYATDSEAIYAPPFSMAELPEPRNLEVIFPVRIEEALQELSVVIDEESLPPGAVVTWDQHPLHPRKVDLYDQGNTAYAIPAQELTRGEHVLRFSAPVTAGSKGLLERPILVGRYLVVEESPLSLGEMPGEWMGLATMKTWPELGIPEGFGPVEYKMKFDIPPGESRSGWELALPPTIGVAEVKINGINMGRSSWEPRVIPVPAELEPGEADVSITVYGSWNNLFSRLNTLANGLSGPVRLVRR